MNKNNPEGILTEFPLMVTELLGKTIPAAGGFYLRLLPLRIIKNTIKSYEKKEIPTSLYVHSWELTPEYIPKIKLPIKNKLITFYKIESTYNKMNKILNEFKFQTFNSY